MFEEYLQDSYAFFEIAKKKTSDREARRYYRASVFYAAGAIEAFVNYIADSFAKAESLTPHEISFLNDKILFFSADTGKLVEKTVFHKLEDKLKFLLRKFVLTFNFGSPIWSKISEFRDFRNSLVHPKKADDEIDVSVYQKKVHDGISSIIKIMDLLFQGIFKKPLRKQLLDLIP